MLKKKSRGKSRACHSLFWMHIKNMKEIFLARAAFMIRNSIFVNSTIRDNQHNRRPHKHSFITSVESHSSL